MVRVMASSSTPLIPLPVHSRTALRQLKNDISAADIGTMLRIYTRDVETHMKAIATAFAGNDAAAVAAKCHAIRSATESLGFTQLTALLLEVEMAASHGNDEERTNFHAGTLTRLMGAYEEIKPYLEQLSAEFASGAN